MIAPPETKMNLIFQSIGLRQDREHLNIARGTKIWNTLDDDLKSIENLNYFKHKLKTGLLQGNIQLS